MGAGPTAGAGHSLSAALETSTADWDQRSPSGCAVPARSCSGPKLIRCEAVPAQSASGCARAGRGRGSRPNQRHDPPPRPTMRSSQLSCAGARAGAVRPGYTPRSKGDKQAAVRAAVAHQVLAPALDMVHPRARALGQAPATFVVGASESRAGFKRGVCRELVITRAGAGHRVEAERAGPRGGPPFPGPLQDGPGNPRAPSAPNIPHPLSDGNSGRSDPENQGMPQGQKSQMLNPLRREYQSCRRF